MTGVDRVRLRGISRVLPSNVDKKVIDGQTPVQLCNYTDVYNHEYISSTLKFMSATASDDQIRAFTLQSGDVLITKDSETAQDIAVPSLVVEDLWGVLCGYHLAVIRPDRRLVAPRFLFRALSTRYVNQQFETQATGVTRYGLRSDVIRDARIPLPDLEHQRLIADFLDRETNRIDALVDAKRRLIDLLAEKRTAITRTEIERAPAQMTKIRYVATVKRGQSPRPIDDPQYFDEDGTHGWVRIEDVSRSAMYLRETKQRLSEAGKARSVPVGPGVVLVSIAASVGKPIITAMDCCYHDGFVGLLGLKADAEFAYHWLSLPERFAGREQIGTQANINSDIVGSVVFPDLEPHEQRRIARMISQKLSVVDALRRAIERQLALLAEYRQALITAAVTGQLDEVTLKGHKPADEVMEFEVPV